MPTDARIAEWEGRLSAGGTIRPSEPEYDAVVLQAIITHLRGLAPPPGESLRTIAAEARVNAVVVSPITAASATTSSPSITSAEKAIEEAVKRRKTTTTH